MKENCHVCINNIDEVCNVHGFRTHPDFCCNDCTPHHYKIGGIETLDYVKAKLTVEEYHGFLKGNVIKYMSRAGYKDDEVQDLKKAQVYLEILISEKENNRNDC